MKKRNFLMLSVALGALFSSLPVLAMDPPPQEKKRTAIKRSSLEPTDDFIGGLKGKFRATLNKKGDHFPDLGPLQKEFYTFCMNLDKNVKKPVIAILGGAYGLRAAEVLNQTKRLTVILNDLEESHFDGIKKWAAINKFSERLILAPGTFFNLDKSEDVHKFFGHCPVKLHGILAANVFHHLSPEEFIKGLGFISDHLLPEGDAFFMSARCKLFGASHNVESTDAALANSILSVREALLHGQKGYDLLRNVGTEDQIQGISTYAEYRQISILYDFNKEHGISFPGYLSIHKGVLNPSSIKLGDFSSTSESTAFFYTTPEEVEQWSKVVGLTYHPISFIDAYEKERYNDIGTISGSSSDGSYYSARLRKDVSSSDIPGKYLNNSNYLKLMRSASNIDNELKQLHAEKEFSVGRVQPYFGITDLKTQERYPCGSFPSSTENMEYNYQLQGELWDRIFKTDGKSLEAVYGYGSVASTLGNHELAAAAFTMGTDLGHEPSRKMLNLMIATGRHSHNKPTT